MRGTAPKVVLLVVMIATIVGMDVLFFRGSAHTTARLIANVCTVLVFGGIYAVFLARD